MSCPACGSNQTSFRREKQGEIRGKRGSVNAYATVGVCKSCGYTWMTDEPTIPKKRKTWLWVLGWICIFPVPLTILLVRNKRMNNIVKYVLIGLAWLIYLAIGLGSKSPETSIETETPIITETPTIEAINQALVFELDSSKAGDYGKEITLNKGKADSDGYSYEYTFYLFDIPAGKYIIKSVSKGAQVSIVKEGTAVNSDGIEELNYSKKQPSVLIDGKTEEIEVAENEKVKLSDSSIVRFEKIG